ncbi:hypothetical protein FF38_05192 [Lucilia cuprina]|uniref:Uncharacterized protein n=2 Tax=Lucilia cuprina TaxID=7375 RepID=A0A0L0C777_LUCCU|nr:hypothetical protein FF38_05192 [Lucilia cuprina]
MVCPTPASHNKDFLNSRPTAVCKDFFNYANDVPTQQPLLYIQPSGVSQQGFINFAGSFIPNTAQSSHTQQQIVNTNSQTAAMSAAAQGYTVMFNPQLTMSTQSQNAATLQQHISSPYILTSQNIQQQLQIPAKQYHPSSVLQQNSADTTHNQPLVSHTTSGATEVNYVTSILPSNSTTTLTQQQTSLPNITNAVSHTIVQQVMPQTMTSVAYPYNTQTEVNLPDSTISPPTQDNSSIHHK